MRSGARFARLTIEKVARLKHSPQRFAWVVKVWSEILKAIERIVIAESSR